MGCRRNLKKKNGVGVCAQRNGSGGEQPPGLVGDGQPPEQPGGEHKGGVAGGAGRVREEQHAAGDGGGRRGGAEVGGDRAAADVRPVEERDAEAGDEQREGYGERGGCYQS